PERLAPSVRLDFAALDAAVARLKTSAAAFDQALAAKGAGLAPAKRKQLDGVLATLEQRLLREQGLPGRPWYRNMVYAPGRFTGYGAKTLPGVREAIEERRFADADEYAKRTAAVLTAYAARLDAARATIESR